jgi:hypothetical protein
MRTVMFALAMLGSFGWTTAATAAETWSCHVVRDDARNINLDEIETLTVDGNFVRVSNDARRYIVDQNDDEKLNAGDIFEAKPPFAIMVTVFKKTGEYNRIEWADKPTRFLRGRCTRQ